MRHSSPDGADFLPLEGVDRASRDSSGAASAHGGPDNRQIMEESHRLQVARETSGQVDKFQLQDAPRIKRSSGSSRKTDSQATTPRADLFNGSTVPKPPVTPTPQEPSDNGQDSPVAGRPSYEYSPIAGTDSPRPLLHQQLQDPPKRGDSLDSAKRAGKTIHRKELNATANIPQVFSDLNSSAPGALKDATDGSKLHGGKTISQPIESLQSKSIFDTQTTHLEPSGGDKVQESFVAPRPPPQPPAGIPSMSGVQRSADQGLTSPALPRWSASGEFTMDEDMARILGKDDLNNPHGSFRSTRLSRDRWPRSPGTNAVLFGGHEISSPITASPETRDELSWFKNELRRERQKTVERERRITELEAALDSTANIKQVTADLKQKRSTMIVLDAQKEIVVRELEVLTEHIAAAKKSGEPLDLNKMNNTVLREFAESLQKLKDSFTPQIEESIQRRNDLVDEISDLTQMKEKSFQEFEQLSSKNAQLAELNNQLVHQIQELYKANAGSSFETGNSPQVANGLGIYSHHKDRSLISFDSRMPSDLSVPGSGTTLQAEEQEAAAAIIQGPHVVNIKKGQARKFNWRKEGKNVAKGVTKGIKGAFSSTQQNYNRDLEFAETAPYGNPPLGQEYSSLPRNNQEPVRQNYGAIGNQRGIPRMNGVFDQQNGSNPSLFIDPSTHLYGSDLEQRAEFEKTVIPNIVLRCIEEVEARGMLLTEVSDAVLLTRYRYGRGRHLP